MIRHIRALILAAIVGLALTIAMQHTTALAQGTAVKQPDTVILKGAPAGGVKFDHKKHAGTDKAKCPTCHHASKTEKPLQNPQQKCTDCHTKAVTAPMKTNTRGAFHDPLFKKGTCVDCHQAEAAKGNKKIPAKCPDCHKKENV
jgi:Zn finger protein HypA/HybF involved in hydrogenase expression